MIDFLLGATATGCVVIALIFRQFWHETGDRFFALFGLAFATFAANRVVLLFLEEDDEARTLVYIARLLAFGIILAAIVDKNRRAAGDVT